MKKDWRLKKSKINSKAYSSLQNNGHISRNLSNVFIFSNVLLLLCLLLQHVYLKQYVQYFMAKFIYRANASHGPTDAMKFHPLKKQTKGGESRPLFIKPCWINCSKKFTCMEYTSFWPWAIHKRLPSPVSTTLWRVKKACGKICRKFC